MNEIHIKGGASKQLGGLIFDEIQHALDDHAGLHNRLGRNNEMIHAVTARELAANPMLPTTAQENAKLVAQANKWWKK